MSGQAATSTPFMKVGDASYGKKVSFNVQNSIGEQLENLTSMYTICLCRKKKVRNHSNPKFIQREQEDREDKILMAEIGHFKIADTDKALDRHKTEEEIVIEGELIDKISSEMIVEIEVDEISEETLAMIEID